MTVDPNPMPHDAEERWAAKVDRMHVNAGLSAYGYNIEGRRVAGPQQGFGRLWQRTYRTRVGDDISPEQLVADWRARFDDYWPRAGHFRGPSPQIEPGDVAPLTGGGLAMGILVLYADETSFTFLTPEGHMFAGLITFSADRDHDGATAARIDILIRCADPLFEAMWPALRVMEDVMWTSVLRRLAAAHGVARARVTARTECLDRRRLRQNWRNIRHNSLIRSMGHDLATPIRILRGSTSGGSAR